MTILTTELARLKTALMWSIEDKYGEPIELILAQPKSLRQIANEIGVTESCVCKWRKRLKLGEAT